MDTERGAIVIPFHHREDLLLPLLEHLKDFQVLVVDDGPSKSDWSKWKVVHTMLECIRGRGSSGFTAAVNVGLAYLEQRGVQYALLHNDDAWVSVDGIHRIFSEMTENRLVSPVIEVGEQKWYGVKIWQCGLIRLNSSPKERCDALLGTCLGIPTRLRLDSRFVHGFEDLHLSWNCAQQGMELCLLEDVICHHEEGGSLLSSSAQGLQYVVKGHLLLLNSIKKIPIVYSLYCFKILSEHSKDSFKSRGMSINYGVVDWLCNAIAERMASSKLGSKSAK